MKQLLLLAVVGLLMSASSAWAKDEVAPYKCTNRAGEVGSGTGRLSSDGEYSAFLKRSVRAGEYVIFRYNNQGKEYWFKASHCTKV